MLRLQACTSDGLLGHLIGRENDPRSLGRFALTRGADLWTAPCIKPQPRFWA